MCYTSQHTSTIAISSLDFLLLSCLHVPLRNALLKITKYMSSTGMNQEFWKTLGYSLGFGLFVVTQISTLWFELRSLSLLSFIHSSLICSLSCIYILHNNLFNLCKCPQFDFKFLATTLNLASAHDHSAVPCSYPFLTSSTFQSTSFSSFTKYFLPTPSSQSNT